VCVCVCVRVCVQRYRYSWLKRRLAQKTGVQRYKHTYIIDFKVRDVLL
jgi:disulfide oxidoreductase YuzD